MYCLSLVSKTDFESLHAQPEESSYNAQHLLVLDYGYGLSTFVRVPSAVIRGRRGGLICDKLQLAYVEDAGKYLAYLSDVAAWKFKFSQSRLEMLESFSIIDTDFELRWMA